MIEPGAEPFFNSRFLYGGVFVNNITKHIKKEGPSIFDRGDQPDLKRPGHEERLAHNIF